MAAAAAAAANAAAIREAAAVAITTTRHITSTADKQLDLLLKQIDPLKDVGYPKVRDQLHRQAYAFGWPPWILDIQAPRPDTAELAL